MPYSLQVGKKRRKGGRGRLFYYGKSRHGAAFDLLGMVKRSVERFLNTLTRTYVLSYNNYGEALPYTVGGEPDSKQLRTSVRNETSKEEYIWEEAICMQDITTLVTILGFALTCFGLGYSLGRNSKANK